MFEECRKDVHLTINVTRVQWIIYDFVEIERGKRRTTVNSRIRDCQVTVRRFLDSGIAMLGTSIINFLKISQQARARAYDRQLKNTFPFITRVASTPGRYGYPSCLNRAQRGPQRCRDRLGPLEPVPMPASIFPTRRTNKAADFARKAGRNAPMAALKPRTRKTMRRSPDAATSGYTFRDAVIVPPPHPPSHPFPFWPKGR